MLRVDGHKAGKCNFICLSSSKIINSLPERKQKAGKKIEVKCPQMIKEYTKRMGGVDKFDQKRGTYRVGRQSKRLWLRIFSFVL